MVATNNSTFTVNGAVVTDIFPAVISGANWSCAADAGASCTPSGTGNISDSVILPPGLKVTYSITAPVSSYAVGTLTNSVSITAPAGFVETTPGDNQAQDSDTCVSTEPGVGPPNGGWLPIPPGSSVILELSQPIVADGDGGVPEGIRALSSC